MTETVTITALTQGPHAIGRRSNGKIVFVAFAVPGDTVSLHIVKETKTFSVGAIDALVDPSPHRVLPPCPYFETCGGCPWMSVDYDFQAKAKRLNVVEALVRIAKLNRQEVEALVEKTKRSKKELGYRNKIELALQFDPTLPSSQKLKVGFHQPEAANIVEIKSCLIANEAIKKAPSALRGALRYLSGNQNLGIHRIGIRTSPRTRSTEVALWTNPGAFPRKHAGSVITQSSNATSVVRVLADEGKARKLKGVEALSGSGYWTERLGDFTYKVSAPSFFQVNTEQAEVMIQTVMDHLEAFSPCTMADLYCGVGTFTLPLCDLADEVYAIESYGSSVRDLRRNLTDNKAYAQVIGGDSARELPGLGKVPALIVDPPRAGLHKSVPKELADAGVEQLVYVSCNPATLARDVARLESEGFKLTRVVPVDLFPQTHHIETISFLTKL